MVQKIIEDEKILMTPGPPNILLTKLLAIVNFVPFP